MKSVARCLTAGLLAAVPVLCWPQPLPESDPASVGLSETGLAAVTDSLQSHIDAGDIAGVVAAVARDGQLVYFEALGQIDLASGRPMPGDALFRIYSMSRQITATAVLQLHERGHFELTDPISDFLPQFADQQVLIDPASTDLTQVRPRNGEITVANLLTHTSGLGSRSSRLYRDNNVRDRGISLDEMVDNAARMPLFEDPGTRFRYGINETILGKLVEVWSGEAFEDYLAANVLEPLGMNDTWFWAEGSDAERLATVYRPNEGQLLPYQIESLPWTARPPLIEGAVGMLSSVPDFVRFSQMVLNRGELDGQRILNPETVALMYTQGVPAAALPIGDSGYWLGSGWTLGGFNLVMNSDAYSFPVSHGTIWWDGSAGTRFFIDPVQDLITVIMAQVSPSRGGGFREDFTRLVDAALMERR